MRNALPRSLSQRARPRRALAPRNAPTRNSSLADALAPDAIVLDQGAIHVDGTSARTLALTAFPRRVTWGWLGRLAALHLEPQDSAQVVRHFGTQLTMLHSSRLFADGRGRLPSPERAGHR